MKKNKFLIILILIITLFSFSSEVNAAQELTCVYDIDSENGDDVIVLIQESNGEKQLHKRRKSKWSKLKAKKIQFWYSYVDEFGNVYDSLTDEERKKANEYIDESATDISNLKYGVYLSHEAILKSCPVEASNDNTFLGFSQQASNFPIIQNYNKVITDLENIDGEEVDVDIPIIIDDPEHVENKFYGKTCDEFIKDGTLKEGESNVLFDSGGRDINCVYIKDEANQCIILQLSFYKDGSNFIFSSNIYSNHLSVLNQQYYTLEQSYGKLYKSLNWKFDKPIDEQYVFDLNGMCPISIENKNGIFYFDSSKQNMRRIYSTNVDVDIPTLITPVTNPDNNLTCEEAIGEEGVKVLRIVKSLVFVVVPIILIVLGSLDIAKAVFAGSEDAMSKSLKKFINRLIISIVIFLIPILLSLILELASNIWPVIDDSLCGIL